jgi:hypothetical protein
MRLTTVISCGLVALTVTALLSPAQVWPADLEDITLKGITAFHVSIERLNPDAEDGGLTRDQIRTDVELRLRKAGIMVSGSAAESLYINVNLIKSPQGLYTYSILVMVRQSTRLLRNPAIMSFATTWWRGSDGLVGSTNLRKVRDILADLVDEFCNTYLEQNPKK